MESRPVFLDANVIVEAYRLKIWKRLRGSYQFYTVDTVIDECKGYEGEDGWVWLDADELKDDIGFYEVSETSGISFMVEYDLFDIDAGERDLMAYLNEYSDEFLISTADFAAIRACVILGWTEHLVSLEKLANDCGLRGIMRYSNQYTERCLCRKRTEYIMDNF